MQYLSLQQGAQKVLRLTERMLDEARAGNWQALGEIENERSRSLNSLFQHPQIIESLVSIADILYQVMSLDRQCMQLGEHERHILLNQMDKQTRGKKAMNSYLKNSE